MHPIVVYFAKNAYFVQRTEVQEAGAGATQAYPVSLTPDQARVLQDLGKKALQRIPGQRIPGSGLPPAQTAAIQGALSQSPREEDAPSPKDEEKTKEELEESNVISFYSQAPSAVLPFAPPPQKKTRTITSTHVTAEDMLYLLGGLLKQAHSNEEGSHDQLAFPYGAVTPPSNLDDCNEVIRIIPLDEGFCLKHRQPVDKHALASVRDVDGDEWKAEYRKEASARGADVPSWVEGLIQIVGPQLMRQGPREVYGFRGAEDVLAYVREAAGAL